MVLVVPRSGMMIASQVHPVQGASELESQKEGFARERRSAFFEATSEAFRQRSEATRNMPEEARKEYEAANEWDWMLESDERQKSMEADIAEFNRKVDEQAANQRLVQQRLGFSLSRFSPAASFQLASMTLGQTDLSLKQRYLTALSEYRTTFRTYVDEKDPGGSFRFGTMPEASAELDLSDMPRFQRPSSSNPARETLLDAVILILYTFIGLAVSFVAFNRYDVR